MTDKTIVRIGVKGSKNARCELADGSQMLVPLAQAVVGWEYVPPVRDMANFDSAKELAYIKKALRSWMQKSCTRLPQGWTVDDVAQEVFVHFWECDTWNKYSPASGPYYKYIYSSAANWLWTFIRSKQIKNTIYFVSLNNKTKNGEGREFLDVVKDQRNYEDQSVFSMSEEQLVSALEGKNCQLGLSYTDIYHGLLDGKSPQVLASEMGVSRNAINLRKEEIKNEWSRLTA